ncbi:MAG TPA: hypothetical protein VLH15_04470, partial [Dehalococcoidales bacterium]|nr:hypothetical protein [Dehalococcoidales bacterium]
VAGVGVSHMFIKPLALTKAIPVNDAIMVDFQSNEFDIVIMINGISQPVRSVSLPSEELSWEQKIKMIAGDLERTIKFYDTNNPEKPLNTSLPVYVSGEFLGKPQYQKMLEEASGRPIMSTVPDLKGLEHLEPGRYMINMAMGLRNAFAGRELTFPVANINLLPTPYQPKPVSLVKVLGIPACSAALSVVVPVIMMMQGTANNIEVLQNQLENTNQVVSQRTLQKQQLKKEISEFEKKVATFTQMAANLDGSLKSIKVSQENIDGDLFLTLSKLSPDIKLKSLKQTGGQLEISGSAPTTNDVHVYVKTVLTYARELDISKRFSQSLISSLSVVTPVQAGSGSTEEPAVTSKEIEFRLILSREK